MTRKDATKTGSQRGLLATLAAGFELVTAHWWVALLPALLDVFYWLGPRLSARPLILELAQLFQQEETMANVGQQLLEVAGQTNLFSVISVPLLGVPGLMAGFVMPEETPLSPAIIEIDNPLTWLLLYLALSVVGLLLATVYYGLVAQAARAGTKGQVALGRFAGWLPAYGLRILVLAVALLLAVLAVFLPILLVATFLTLLSPAFGSLVILLAPALLLWLVFYLSFSMHGILLADRPVFGAMLASARLVQRFWLPSLLLFLMVLSIRNLLTWLWLLVDTGGWLTLASIAGHAFVSTGLIAATFIFYRDRMELLQAPDGQGRGELNRNTRI